MGSYKLVLICCSWFYGNQYECQTQQRTKGKNVQENIIKKPTDKISVAKIVEFLLSDSSLSVTGQNIFVESVTI